MAQSLLVKPLRSTIAPRLATAPILAAGPVSLGIACLARRHLSISCPETSKLFNFTRGRFISDEQANLTKRRVKFDPSALGHVAAQAIGAKQTVKIDKFPDGNFNKAFLLTVDDGREVVAKIPNPNAGLPRLTTASEVASMHFFKHVTKTPIPEVLSYSAKTDNAVGSEYIVMEKAKGVTLVSIWHKLPFDKKVQLVNKLAQYHKAWTSIKFDQYGSLYFPQDLQGAQPDLDSDELKGALYTHNGKDIRDTRYVVGPAVGREWCSEGKENLTFNRGPFSSVLEYRQAALVRERQAIIEARDKFPQQYGMICGPAPFYAPTGDKKLQALEEYKHLLKNPHIFFPEDSLELFEGHMWHNDLHAENIFVDEKDPAKITGIVDWQSSAIAPLVEHCLDPHLLEACGFGVDDTLSPMGLPHNFHEMSHHTKKAHEGKELMLAWRHAVKKENPKQRRALAFQQTPLGRIWHLSRHLLGPSEAHLARWLTFLQDDWLTDNEGKKFPIPFSPLRMNSIHEDLKHAKFSVDMACAMRRELATRLGEDLWPDGGVVSEKQYDTVKQMLNTLKKELMDRHFPPNQAYPGELQLERQLFERQWPF